MNSYERLMRAFDFEEPDRVPIWDTTNNLRIIREVGGEGPPEKVIPRACHRLGLDVDWGIGDLLRDEHLIEGTWKTYEWNNLVFENPLTLRRRKFENAAYFVPYVVERPFKNLEDLRDMKIELARSEDEIIEANLSSYKETREHYDKYGIPVIGGSSPILERLPLLFGWSLLARAIYHARDVIGKLMDLFMVVSKAHIKACIENDVPAIVHCDDCAEKHGLMYPITFLREMWVPRMKEIVRPVRKAGIHLVYHSEGNTEVLLNDVIDIGFRGHHPIEPGSMDIGSIKEKFGDRLVLLGGIDNWNLLQNGTPTEVDRSVKETIRKAAPGSGFCCGSSGELNPRTPLRNAIAMYRAIKRYGKYPERTL